MDITWKAGLLALLLLVCAAPLAAASERPSFEGGESVLATLRPSHPRLLATEETFERLAQLVSEDQTAARWFGQVLAEANSLLTAQPSRYEIPDGLRLLGTSRQVLGRVYTLALAYRLTGDGRYAERAWRELEAAANFPDWNPRHFLDTAEMTHAFAIGYDWLYDVWTEEQRDILRRAIVDLGLLPALESYRGATGDWNRHGWVTTEINWNLVANGGIALGALAVAEDEPELAEEIVRASLESVRHSIHRFAPDGGWDEGVSYWAYSVRYLVTYLAGLHSALGTEFGLADVAGISETGYFPIYMTGPSGIPYNFSDSWEDLQAPEMLWLAGRYDEPEFARWFLGPGGARGDARRLLWYDPLLAGRFDARMLPLDRYFRLVETATFRSAWDDRNAVFLGFRGGDNRAGHAHLDKGSFLLEAHGVRWAIDLGPDDYNLPGYFSGGAVSLYRIRAEGHNTLVINPNGGPDQVPSGVARIEFFRSTPGEAVAVADLTPVYRDAVSVKRGVALFNDRRQVLIQDEWTLRVPGEVWWFMHTQAAVSVEEDGATAILSQGGRRLVARILAPAGARFEVMDARPLPTSPDPAGQARNANVRKLAIHLEGTATERLVVLLSPLSFGEAISLDPEILPLEAWKAQGEGAEGAPEAGRGEPLWPPTPVIKVGVRSPAGLGSVHGVVPLEIDIEAPDGVEVENVEVALSGSTIYSGPGAPQDAAIDTRSFSDGEHALAVVVRTSGGGTATYFSRFAIENEWSLVDELEPPMNLGFFGVVNRSKVSEMSEGWIHVSDDPGTFGGDESRMANERGEGYLIWDAPNLNAFRLRLYGARDALGGAALSDVVEIAVSADGERWEPLAYEAALVHPEGSSSSTGSWNAFELSGNLGNDAGDVSGGETGIRRFRVAIRGAGPGAVQLGRLELSGIK